MSEFEKEDPKEVRTDDGELTAKSGPKMLTAEEIFAADDIEVALVEVPEWGGAVLLRAMSGEEAGKFVEALKDDTHKTTQAIKIVALCAVDEKGAPLFSEHQVGRLAKKSLRALMRLQTKAIEINGLSTEETTKLKKD